MKRFEKLTKYINEIKTDEIGEWIHNNNKKSNSISAYVKYTPLVNSFVDEVYEFVDQNKGYDLYDYNKILQDYKMESMLMLCEKEDIALLNEKCIMAMIVAVVRSERFSEGSLLSFLKKGQALTLLNRLKEIDDESSN